MAIGKASCSCAARRNQCYGEVPIAVCGARVDVCRRTADCPSLIVCAGVLVLNRKVFALRQQRQEDVYVNVVVGQVTDIDRCCACLRGVVPKQVTVTGVAGG